MPLMHFNLSGYRELEMPECTVKQWIIETMRLFAGCRLM
jgi:hypothetical protein